MKTDSTGWSRDELKATVDAYLEMQRLERAEHPFVKKHYYEELEQRFGRRAEDYEYRMQNISYVLVLMGQPWLSGSRPANNVGSHVAAEIEAVLMDSTGYHRAPVAGFEAAVNEARERDDHPAPVGANKPRMHEQRVTQYQRDPAVKAWILRHAGGVCECCHKPAPFVDADGHPYLELHHVRQLSEGGSDRITNCVAVCPNCHRALHHGQDALALTAHLLASIHRLKRE